MRVVFGFGLHIEDWTGIPDMIQSDETVKLPSNSANHPEIEQAGRVASRPMGLSTSVSSVGWNAKSGKVPFEGWEACSPFQSVMKPSFAGS